MTFRLLVTGGRDYDETAHIRATLDRIHAKRPITVLIHGKARGVDTTAAEWAAEHEEIEVRAYPANWAKLGKKAGPIRNQWMLDDGKPDGVAAFHGGVGTADMVARADAAGIKIMRVKYTDDYELSTIGRKTRSG